MPIEREAGAVACNDGFWFIAKLGNRVPDITSVIASPASCEEHAFGMTGVAIQGPARLRLGNGPSKKYRLFAALSVFILTTAGVVAPSQSSELPLRGVNISGAELNGNKLPGRLDVDYIYPTEAELDYFSAAGMTVIRLPILWERLQPRLGEPLDMRELTYVSRMVGGTRRRGMSLIIDLHNYGAYRGQKVGTAAVSTAQFAKFWERMAVVFRDDENVIFGLMNEPHDIKADAWAISAQAAINSIRVGGFQRLVLVSGTGWDGAHNFVSGSPNDGSNAIALEGLYDPANALSFEVHQYLDENFSGTGPECPAAPRATSLLKPFTDWLRTNRKRGFLGEIGVSNQPACLKALASILDHIAGNSDVWAGWTYWAAGRWWSDTYPFSIEPQSSRATAQFEVIRATNTSLR